MSDPNAQTPDQQAATGTPGQPELMSQGGLLDALRSRGTLPSMLPQQMMMAQQAPNGGLAVGSGMLNAASGGNAALNPYLQQHQQQQNTQFWQQQRLQQQVQRSRDKQDELRNKVIESLGRSDNPDAQKTYALEMAKTAKSVGVDVSPESFAQTAKLSKEERDQIDGDIVANLPREQIMARNPKLLRLAPDWLDSQVKILQSPAMRKKLGYATDDELISARAEREEKVTTAELKTWKSQNLDIDDKSLPYVAQYVQTHGGMPLKGLDPSNPVHKELKREALAWAQTQMQANDPARAGQIETARANQVREAETGRHNLATEATSRMSAETARMAAQRVASGTDKPMAAPTIGLITGSVRLSDAVARIDQASDSPKKKAALDNYIGPYASRMITAQQYAPLGMAGKTPTEVVDLQQNLATMKNYVIKLITGAQMGEKEAERIMTELPSITLPPDQFWRRYETSKVEIGRMKQIVEALVVRGDPRALQLMRELEVTPPATPAAPTGPLSPSPAPGAGWGKMQKVQ